MALANLVSWLAAGLIVARWLAELWLTSLNRGHVRAHAGAVPAPFRQSIDEATYVRSVQYTLAKSRLSQFSDTCDAAVLLLVLFSGVLPRAFDFVSARLGSSAAATAAYIFGVGVLVALPGMPVDWFEQFRLEQRFGFNTASQKTWWLDRLKGILLALILGYPLLVLVMKFVEWAGDRWWLWAWGAALVFQLVMIVLAPVIILPLFNKFTPLPAGSLRERLEQLAARADFRAQRIQVMDGSRRSHHSNAFFTGFGRFRKIVLFDTLIQQLSEAELEAVLAHEIGHYKKKHIARMLVWSALGSLAGFYLIAVLARQGWFYRAFGFQPGHLAPVLLVSGLLAGTVTFWFSPWLHWWSRRFEYQADAFAAHVMGGAHPLVSALRKLTEKNLGNLTPHPAYSAFYYSHPTVLERERALMGLSDRMEHQVFDRSRGCR